MRHIKMGGTLEKVQMMTAHESPRTTKLYDRTNDSVSLDEVERVVFRPTAARTKGHELARLLVTPEAYGGQTPTRQQRIC